MSDEEARTCSQFAPECEVNENGLLMFHPRLSGSSEDRIERIRLVVPELLQQYFMHQYHTSLEGDT